MLAANDANAQNYSSETGLVDLLSKIWEDAMKSNADIYSVVFDDSYDIPDYSKYGNFSQEIHFYSNIDDYMSPNVGDSVANSYKTVLIDKSGTITVIEYGDSISNTILLPELECYSRCLKYCSLCGKWILVEEWDGHHSSATIPSNDNDDTSPTAGGGGANSGNGNSGDDTPVGALPSSGRITVKDLLSPKRYGVHIANLNIPKEFHEQTLKYECVARGIANVAQIAGKDYDVAYSVLSDIAEKEGYNLNSDGIPDKDINKLFGNYVTLSRNPCSETFIDSQIDAHNNVLVSIWTEDGPHMVTVLGYDEHNYYCAAGFKDIDIIKKEFVDTNRSAFIVKQFNGPYK